jgi:hypothetical protein
LQSHVGSEFVLALGGAVEAHGANRLRSTGPSSSQSS